MTWDGTGTPIPSGPGYSRTKLQAINEVLEASGRRHVNALDTGGSSEAGQAERVLDRISAQIQAKGWYENTEDGGGTGIEMVPDGSKHITVDADVLFIDTVGLSVVKNVAVRNGRLYDLDNQTDEFDDSVYVKIVRELDFADLTMGIQRLIIARAAQIFQRRRTEQVSRDLFLRDEMIAAERDAGQSDQETADRNVLQTAHAASILGTPYDVHPRR